MIENLNVASMLSKVKYSGNVPKKEQSKPKTSKMIPSKRGRRRGSRGLRRTVQNTSLGMVKDWITHYCLKNGITIYVVNPNTRVRPATSAGWQ